MFRFTQAKDNAVSATYQYLKAIGAKVTEETVEETLKNHPDYPSLLATSDALNEWHIENVAVRITPEQLGELPTPFLTYLRTDYGIFALVKSVKDGAVEWIHTKEGFKRDKIEEFLTKWDGIVLMAETNAVSGERNFAENHKKEILSKLRLPVLLFGVAVLVFSLFYNNFTSDWQYNALLLTKFAGIVVSSLLLWQSIDKNNPFIKSLCSPSASGGSTGRKAGKGLGCNEILNSKAAQVTSWLNWSEVGFFYFVGGFVALLTPRGRTEIITLLSILSVGYTFWSIYYQAFVAKQWCTLCLAIQGIILIEFLIAITTFSYERIFDSPIGGWGAVIVGAGGAALFWIFLKPFLQKSQQVVPLKNDLKRFKNNPNLFLSLLEKQDRMPFVPQSMRTIIVGNPNADHTITMITNPFCQPCAKAHQTIEEIIDGNENVKCQVIFLASNVADDKRGIVARIILSLPHDQQAHALHQWYENEERNIEKWQAQLGIIEDTKTVSIIEQHRVWCELAKVTATPTLYINGYKMPDLYYRADLKGILKYLPITDLQINHK